MNNKNTLLLTVIAVATLLVAVVGATFAYFTVSSATGTANTTVTASAEKIGSITLSPVNGALKLNVTAAEMAQTSQNAVYYAVAQADPKNNNTTATPVEIAKATITDPGESSYTCTATFTVAASGTMASALAEGDAKVVLSGAASGTFDLSSAQLEESSTAQATFKLSKTQLSQSVSALVSLTNTTKSQNALAGQTLTVNITSDKITCVVDK